MGDWLVYHEKPITLHSGGRSHWLVDGRAIFDDPHLRESVLTCWEWVLTPKAVTLNNPHVIGVPTGGLCWAKALAERMGWKTLPLLGHEIVYGFKVLVDDVYTTGRSLDVMSISGNPLDARRLVVVGRKNAELRPEGVTAWAWIDLELLG